MASLVLVGVVLVTTGVSEVAGQCLSNATCNNHGYCPSPITCFTDCNCVDGYTGEFCTVPPDCSDNGVQCAENGECVNYKCVCSNKYTGKLCEIPPICTDTGNECGQYGECFTCSAITNVCICNSGYGGDTCNIAPVCTEGGNECKNGGECNFLLKPFNCTCPPGYPGDTCGAHHVTFFVTSLVLPLLASVTIL